MNIVVEMVHLILNPRDTTIRRENLYVGSKTSSDSIQKRLAACSMALLSIGQIENNTLPLLSAAEEGGVFGQKRGISRALEKNGAQGLTALDLALAHRILTIRCA